jgi:hypothetical protein
MLKFAKIGFQLPDVEEPVIEGYGSMVSNSKQLDFFHIRGSEGRKFKIAIDPLLCQQDPESLLGASLSTMIRQPATDAEKPTFFTVDIDFSAIRGAITSTRTFNFGNLILFEMIIEKDNGKSVNIAFLPHRRRRWPEAYPVGKIITVSPGLIAG